jgi:hypothetical protein
MVVRSVEHCVEAKQCQPQAIITLEGIMAKLDIISKVKDVALSINNVAEWNSKWAVILV